MVDEVRPKIDDQFWFNYSEKLINESHDNANESAKKLQNLILWLWGIYTTYSVIGTKLQESHYPFYVTLSIVFTSLILIVVYWGTVWVQMPVKTSFDPRSPEEIEKAYKKILKTKIRRFNITLLLSLIAALMVSLSLILMSTNTKGNSKVKTEKSISKSYISKPFKSITLYFDRGSILPKVDNELDILEKKMIEKSNDKNKYIIKITGFSSTEIVQSKNTISDNYQISIARANNVKKKILDIVDKHHFKRENIIIDIFANSNQNIAETGVINHQKNRKVEIEIIELIQT